MKKFPLTLALLALVPSLVEAQVVINEIAWMGSPVAGVEQRQEWRYEWLELYNASGETVSLQGWNIQLHNAEGQLEFAIGLDGTIEPSDYLLVASSGKIPGADVNYGTVAGKFVNSGQKVVLHHANGTIVEEVDAASGWFAGDNDSKLTMERRFPDRDANDEENWGTSLAIGGTPKALNSVFGQEAVLRLGPAVASFDGTKKSPGWLPALEIFGNRAVILASLLALGSVGGMLELRRYLIREARGASSFDVRQD